MEETLKELTPEERRAMTGALRGGPMPKDWTIEALAKPEVMAELLYRAQDLTDDAYEELIDDIGTRAARLVLRAKAVTGDVKAIDLFLRVARDAKQARESKRTRGSAERDVTPSQFLPADRESK